MVDLCATTSGAIYVDTSLDHLGKTEATSKARRYVLPLNSSGDKVYTSVAKYYSGRSKLIWSV